LILGHVTRDIADSSVRYGGTASYAALTARNLGERVGLITSAADDFPFADVLPHVCVARVPSSTTTVFTNIYTASGRRQFVRAVAARIHPHNVPKPWRAAPIVHLAPIVQELDPRVAQLFPHSLVGVTAQGWLRKWDSEGQVHRVEWTDASRVLPFIDVVIVSEDDIDASREMIRGFASQVGVVVVTLGAQGADVYYRGHVHHSPAFPARVVDPTGAGDAFAAAFLVKFSRTGDPLGAARFANCVASFVVEGVGLSGIPSVEQVNQRMETAAV